LLMSFASPRRLDTMQNHFLDWGKFDDKKDIKDNEDYETPKDGQVSEESDQLLRPNSFERVYNLDGARKYLVHWEDPNKYQYRPVDVETNDKFFINLFLPQTDEITATNNLVSSFKQLSLCSTFDEFLFGFLADMYRLPHGQRINLVMSLRKYYNEYKNNEYNKDGFDKHPPKDDGFMPVTHETLQQLKQIEDLPF